MNAPELLAALHTSLATQYPTRRALSARPGRVSCVVELTNGTYDPAPCEPTPFHLEVDVHIQAATSDEKGIEDLPHHLTPVASLIRAAGFTPEGWGSNSGTGDVPELIITASAFGQE